MTISVPTGNFRSVKWIVSPTFGLGTHTSITEATTAASSGDTIKIRDGTYVENWTPKAGVNYVADSGSDSTPTVTIIGEAAFSAAGTITFSNIRFQTNAGFFLNLSGSNASNVIFNSCTLNSTNHMGISYTSSSASSSLTIDNCDGDIGTTGISLFSMSSTGTFQMTISAIGNSGNSTTASTVSAGLFGPNFNTLGFPVTTSGTAAIASLFNNYENVATNTTCLIVGGSGGCVSRGDSFTSGTASAVSISTTATMAQIEVDSSNANAIAGAGTLTTGIMTFTGSSSTFAGTLTVNKLTTYGGTII